MEPLSMTPTIVNVTGNYGLCNAQAEAMQCCMSMGQAKYVVMLWEELSHLRSGVGTIGNIYHAQGLHG